MTKMSFQALFYSIGLLLLANSHPCWSFTHPRTPLRSTTAISSNSALYASSDQKKKLRVVIVGGGWAGFSAADAFGGDNDVEIDLLDASPRGPGGLAGGWRTPLLNRPVEAGLHGFWRDYTNTFRAIERIGLDLDDILTPYTPSILVSETGKVAVAPVLGQDGDVLDSNVLSKFPEPLQRIAKLLPPPLDIALFSDFNSASPLSIIDRISAIGLLGIWADFQQEDKESWKRYDGISAEQLFLNTAGVTPTLYRELVTPLLHVLPMTPGYDCSAAAALSCFHVFALQSKGAFDVRWCRGSIAERIFNPWASLLQERGVNIRGSSKVTAITTSSSSEKKYQVTINDSETIECDAIIMAVGGTAMKRLVPQCPPLQQLPNKIDWDKLRGVTCVAVRLFLKPSSTTTELKEGTSTQLPPNMADAMRESPIVVCGPRVLTKELGETGFCLYDLQRLQDEFAVSRDSTAALEVDFFRADSLAAKTDQEVVDVTLRAVAAALNVDPLDISHVLDFSVVRARNAVSHFCVDSASVSPDVKLNDKGLYICGDWIDRTGHASWSTEKAVVTGRQAVQALAQDFNLSDVDAEIIPVPADSPPLIALRQVAKTVRNAVPTDAIPAAPWMLYQQLRGLL